MPPRRSPPLLLLYPMVQERAAIWQTMPTWGRKNLAAYAGDRQALDAAITIVKERGGRAYSGLAASWGGKFKVGDVPFYAFFSKANVPAVAFLYHSMALTADIMVRFNEWNPSHYRLFNIRTVVAPAGADPVVPPFLMPLGQNGRFRIFEAPGDSYFDLVDVSASVKTTRNNFYDVNDRWLQSDWVHQARAPAARLAWRCCAAHRAAGSGRCARRQCPCCPPPERCGASSGTAKFIERSWKPSGPATRSSK